VPDLALEFSARAGGATAFKTDCLIVPVPGKLPLPAAAAAIDAATGGQISALVETGDFAGSLGAALLLHRPTGLTAERLLLIGTGK
jgi:leucyl aminopeptidase